MTANQNERAITPRRILVVDDDQSVAQTMRLILKIDRHEVEIAEDGEQALSMFRAAPYDLVITDFKMANMDGLELARSLRLLRPGLPIILITAYMEALQSSKAALTDVNSLLGKPFSMEELRKAIQTLSLNEPA
jgi:CheY-like chemotaxis protein